MAHFDLLHLSRKIWKNRLASRALQDLEHEILEIPRTDDEVPGWMIPEIYFNYLRSNDPNPLKGVVYHNGMDILSLAALFVYLSTSFENIQDSSQFNPIDYYSLGQIYFDLGLKEIAQNIFFQCIQQDSLPVQFKLIVFQRIAEIDKSQNNYEEALVYWQKAADFEDIDSSIEIAKYYEHTVKDYQSAYAWTENAISFLAKKGYHSYQNKKLGKELLKRKDRLQQRIERKNNHV
jgi:tetratricopeptide (TPR) repeat protein